MWPLKKLHYKIDYCELFVNQEKNLQEREEKKSFFNRDDGSETCGRGWGGGDWK